MLLSKHHGLGNDFLVVLDERNDAGSGAVGGDDARRLCDRRRGIGADGLIHGAVPNDEQAAHGIDVVMHLYNSDGSRAEMSGNGIRCLAHAVARQRGLDTGALDVLTDAGRRRVEIEAGASPDELLVRVDMGTPTPGPHVPEGLDEFFANRHGTIDMGNPHLVIQVPDPELVELATEGAWLERQFPQGINVEYVTVQGARLQLRVWERGAGITEACGTGACAAAHLAREWGLVGDDVVVSMPGGEVLVRHSHLDGSLTLTGPSVFIADVSVPAPGGAAADPLGPASGLRPVEA